MQKPPERSLKHDALEIFLGDWKAEGQSFGGPDQESEQPAAVVFAGRRAIASLALMPGQARERGSCSPATTLLTVSGFDVGCGALFVG